VIAATNRNPQDLIREGKFREDLYYRIHVFPIKIPSLLERGEDVILLAQSFADGFAHKMGRKLKPLSPECRMRLRTYPWPGNIRELQNVIERAVITSVDGNLNLERALPDIPSVAMEPGAKTSPDNKVWKAKEMEELERKNLVRALELTGWRISGKDGAAQILGLKPSTLTSRMKALGITRPRAV